MLAGEGACDALASPLLTCPLLAPLEPLGKRLGAGQCQTLAKGYRASWSLLGAFLEVCPERAY